ncbi:DUF1949 domain-containing protein [Paenibacillus sp. P26]|nr:DUF1949 domain-containing protein [Paenibacillus sp. P26]
MARQGRERVAGARDADGETSFTDKVTLCCLPLAGEADAFAAWITDVTQGQALIMPGKNVILSLPSSRERGRRLSNRLAEHRGAERIWQEKQWRRN